MKIKKQMICFNCVDPIDRKAPAKAANSHTKEHIPIRSLFDGFSNEYKINRITVDCCYKCNSTTSANDEIFRNLIGTISNDPRASIIADSTLQSMLHHKKEFHNIYINPNGGSGVTAFQENDLIEYQKKVFRGLYFHQYKKAFPKESMISPGLPGEKQIPVLWVVKYLEDNFNYKHSGHPDVFQYIIQPYRQNLTNADKKDLIPNDNDERYVAVTIYHKIFVSVILSTFNEESLQQYR